MIYGEKKYYMIWFYNTLATNVVRCREDQVWHIKSKNILLKRLPHLGLYDRAGQIKLTGQHKKTHRERVSAAPNTAGMSSSISSVDPLYSELSL